MHTRQMADVGIDFEFIAATVPAILIVGGILMLVLNLTPLGAPVAWGWALIIIGVLVYVAEIFFGRDL